MRLITIDLETFYSQDYTLSKLTTEAYVRDPRFEVILCGFKVDDGPSYWAPRDEIGAELKRLRIEECAVVMHHAHFDGLILNHYYDARPKLIIDTLGMARALHGANGRLSLAKLAERYGLGQKGTEVLNAKGLRYGDFSQEALARYGEYCRQDVDLTYELAKRMAPHFSREELQINDHVVRMFTEPVLELDVPMLRQYADKLRAEKITLMMQAGVQQVDLMSNPKFALVLQELGVDPPTKVSAKTGKEAYAFAKTDIAMQALQEHPDERVQILVEARLKNKTTIAEKGAERLIGMAERGAATVYLKYSGASGSHRLSGGDAVNWQALKRGSDLRKAVMAPPGHMCVVGDSSNIEARILDWLAGQDDMVQVYIDNDAGKGPDKYCLMAERIYKRPISKEKDKLERQVGKVCVAEGTLVLCYDGWKPIEQVAAGDRVWDGEEWVWAQGSVCNGLRPTLRLCGAWLTPDHLVWSGTQWKAAESLALDAAIRSQALAFAAANLPSRGTSRAFAAACSISSSSASADARSTPSAHTTSRNLGRSGAISALYGLARALENRIGGTRMWLAMTRTASGFLTACHRLYRDAITLAMRNTLPMAGGALLCMRLGAQIAANSSDMLFGRRAGTTPPWTWIGATTIKGISPETSGSSPDQRTRGTNVALAECKSGSPNLRRKLRVYDVLNCGPRHRFTVMTSEGPLVVHNCVLGLGYSMGHIKFISALRGQAKGPDGKPMVIDEAFSKKVVDIYRGAHQQVVKLWKRGDGALQAIARGEIGTGVDFRGVVKTCKDGLLMPGGLMITYPELQYSKEGRAFGGEWTFWNGKTREHIYGGKVIENICQCLGRLIVFEQCLNAAKELKGLAKWVHSVHDEGVFVASAFEAPYALEVLMGHMRTPPAWCASLPVNCEGGIHQRYGLAKS